MPLAEAVSASSLLFYWQAQYQGQCGQSFHDVKAVLVCQLRFDTCLQGSIRRTFPPSPSAGSICRTFSPSAAKIRQSADSAKVRQIWYQVCRFGESSADSAKVRQIQRKFGRFGKSSADSAKVRQIRQKFGRFGKSSADSVKVRQIWQKFGRFGKSSADSAKVLQIQQKFGKFGKSSADYTYMALAAELIAIRRTFRKVRLIKVLGQEPHPLYNPAKVRQLDQKFKMEQLKFGRCTKSSADEDSPSAQ